MMKKIISFSVWGNDPKYINGCIENIRLAKDLYPGWTTRFYCDSKVDELHTRKIEYLGGEVVMMKTLDSPWEGLFWRFYPASEKNVEAFISRDIDSRLNEREQAAVKEWLESDKTIHCMRDHVEHNVSMLGGMWGCKCGVIPDIFTDIKQWGKYNYKGSDQDFLNQVIWQRYKQFVIAHDRFFNSLVIEQVVNNEEEYLRQRNDYNEYRQKSVLAKQIYISEMKSKGIGEINYDYVNSIFPDIPELKPLKYNEDGKLLYDYVYDPIKYFGQHDVRPFPSHDKMNYGTYVGEII